MLFEHFYKNKTSHHKQKQLNLCFLWSYYFVSIIFPLHRSIRQIENLFISLRALSESSKVSYSFYTTAVNNGLREPYLLLINSSFKLRLSVLRGMANLGKICQNFDSKDEKRYSKKENVIIIFFENPVKLQLFFKS